MYELIVWSGDVVSVALSEDGKVLGSHFSSNINFAKHDMGLIPNWKHDRYNEHFPDGFLLEWVDREFFKTHEGFANACKIYNEQSKDTK